MSEKLTVVVPNEDKFDPAEIPFGVVTGEGVDNFDGDGKVYSSSLLLGKKEAKFFRKEVMDFWEDNKPKHGGDEPDNWDNIVRKADSGGYILYAKTNVDFDGKQNIIAIVNHEGTKLDPEEYGTMGKGTKGRLAVTFSVYTQGKKKSGVSIFLSAVKLTEHEPYVASGGAGAFGSDDKGSVSGKGGFKKEKKAKKKRKKSNNSSL